MSTPTSMSCVLHNGEMRARAALLFSYLHNARGTRGTLAQGADAQALNGSAGGMNRDAK